VGEFEDRHLFGPTLGFAPQQIDLAAFVSATRARICRKSRCSLLCGALPGDFDDIAFRSPCGFGGATQANALVTGVGQLIKVACLFFGFSFLSYHPEGAPSSDDRSGAGGGDGQAGER
jgi:hypothetical protein